jgi:hypothetical protein
MYAISPNITKLTTVSQELIVSVNEIGTWKNLSPSAIIMHNDMLEELITTTTEIIEDYTWLSLRQKTFEAYYDLQSCLFTQFIRGNLKLGLERSPILSTDNITKIEYLANDVWNEFDRGTMTIDGLYENVTEKLEQRQWASIRFRENVPFECRCNAYKIRVTFISGYSPTETDPALQIPSRLKTAIKKIVAFHYTYRGDCQSDCNLGGYPIPCDTKGVIDAISVKNSMLGGDYTPASDYYGDCCEV